MRDHSFIQNHSRSSDSQLLLFSSPHSSSTGFRSENTWHEIRDHSFIQNHSRSSDSQLLLFSSLTHLLQGSGQRTPDTRSETIPSSRITPDLQIHSFFSSVHSLIFYRVQVREHRTRDQRPFLHPESLQIFRFTASPLQFTHLLQGSGQRTPDTRSETIPSSRITPDLQIHSFFSSVHLTHLLQGSGQRTPDTRSETIPSSRITPDLQIHSFFSSVHLTHLLQGSGQRTPDTRSETIPSSRITPDLQIHRSMTVLHLFTTGFRSEDGHSRSLVLCSVTHFCVVFEVCVWIIVRLEDPNMAHYKIYNRVDHLLIFYLLVFDRIHDAMRLNKMSRTSSRNIGPQYQKYSSIFHCIQGYFLFLCPPNPSWVFAAKKLNFLVSSDHRSQSHLKFQSCLTTEYAGVCFWMSEDNFSWNPPKHHVVM